MKVLVLTTLVLIGMISSQADGQLSTACNSVSDHQFVRNSYSCNSFHQCMNNEVHGSGVCPNGTMFDAIHQVCDAEINVSCNMCSLKGVQNLPIDGSDNEFIQCENGVGVLSTCPINFYFDKRLGLCQRQILCIRNICQGVEDFTIIVDPYNCNTYFTCFENRKYARICDSGLYYNLESQVCDFPDNVDCQVSTVEL